MWTNVFRIGGLHQISWFQFLPLESDVNPSPDESLKLEEDAATFSVLSSHAQLQKKGFLTAWTNSFVGPWDPSQGMYNPDEKIKLWFFLPGRHSSVDDMAQAAVSRLRVVASGLWVAPGDSEEVAAALSQALRNCIERTLGKFSYRRFGNVFSKFNPYQNEEIFRRGQQAVEFVFAATEEAIFVHVIISARHVRPLSSEDLERVLKRSSNSSSNKLPVIVSPNGMRGRLTGCCSSDLVKQVYSSKLRGSDGFISQASHVSQSFGCQLRGQSCYAEVAIGCLLSERKNDELESQDQSSSTYEKTFMYPTEAVLVPVLQTSLTRSSLKRLWLQNWLGPSLSGSSFYMHCTSDMDSIEGWTETNGVRTQNSQYSSSNSNSSSLSGMSSSSSESDFKMASAAGDYGADADSLTCKQSDISSTSHLENDLLNVGVKRPRAAIAESYGQVHTGGVAPTQDAYKSDFGSTEVNSAITGVANESLGSHLDWDDDDRGCMDIQALLSEFGDFGDFFENDVLPFGEPPGTAESQALMFSGSDLVGSSSPVGLLDVQDQILLPVGFQSFESFNPPPAVKEESVSKSQETNLPVGPPNTPPAPNREFDHLMKAEALMTFAEEYGAVENPASDIALSIFRSPYVPKSCKVESSSSSTNNYKYGATPPSSPGRDGTEEKSGNATSKAYQGRHELNDVHQSRDYYIYVDGGKVQEDRKSCQVKNNTSLEVAPSSFAFASVSSADAGKPVSRKLIEGTSGAEHLLLSMKTLPATEVDCVMFQASLCKIRYTLPSSTNPASIGLNKIGGSNILSHLGGDQSSMTDHISNLYEVKKKESIPVRIAGDFDGGLLDGHINAPVGVWRNIPKVPKSSNSPSIEIGASLPHHSFGEEGILTYGQRQPLQDLLDGISLLVQQATAFVDVALDADCGDGPFGWLALEEQSRRGFSCGPSMVHAGCGGTLASCHSLDIAGLELIDPLSADVQASSVISLLQSDIKSSLKAAFRNLDGPLSVTDWCKGRGQVVDTVNMGDVFSAESSVGECRDPSSTMTLSGGEPLSPCQSTVGPTSLKASSVTDGGKTDDSSQRRSSHESTPEAEQQLSSRLKPTLHVLPFPAILVGYQDDWLKASANSLQLWEKAPLEPYALQKPLTYYVICPDIDPLTSAAADFFQQLGTVYETCKLGTHLPQISGNQMEIDSGKCSTSGFVLLDCPQSMKMESSNASLVGSISDYFLSLSNGWDLTSYLKSLSKALKALKLGSHLVTNSKEGTGGSCMVIYVVCPFPEPNAVLKTVIESSVAIGSIILPSDKRAALYNQVGKGLSCSTGVDEASTSNVLILSGFSVSKLVLQIVTVDAIFRVTSPIFSELTIFKEIAFTVYNKARRISRGSSCDVQSLSSSSRSQSVMTQMNSPISAMYGVGPRITGASLSRESEMDASLRTTAWDNSWQTRTGGLSCDTGRAGDFALHEDLRFMFEPLYILAEPGSLEHGVSPTPFGGLGSEASKLHSADSSGGFVQSASSVGSVNAGSSFQGDGSGSESFVSGSQKVPSMHCCYGWTEDWRWLVCIWTDARGELLDSQIFPFGGISSRQDTKGLQCLFAQVLQQGCHILQTCCADNGPVKPRDFVVTRIGSFYELEYLEWQKAIYSVGGAEIKSWPLQLRRSMSDGMSGTAGGPLQQEMGLIQERALPSSPSPLYSPHSKTSSYMKSGLGQQTARKQLIGGHASLDGSKGILQWVQSISFVTISIDHSLQLVLQADSLSPGGSQGGSSTTLPVYLEGFTPVKSLGSASSSFMLIPSPSMRFLPPTPLQLPTCLKAESPPLAHLLHSKGSAIPLSTAFVVSKAVPSMRKDSSGSLKDEWPSVLSVGLIDYFGGVSTSRGIVKQGGRTLNSEAKDFEVETHLVLESIAAELQALSWMTVSPAYIERRTALPFHCDMVLRLRRLLHFAEKELSRRPDKS